MKYIILLLIITNILTPSYCQLQQTKGEIFLTDDLKQFEIKTDSLLDISVNKLWCRYSVIKDTLILKAKEKFENGDFNFLYKILVNNHDSIFLTPVILPGTKTYLKSDTIRFISVKSRAVPLNDFKYFRIDEYGTFGSKRLIIDSNKMVQVSNSGFFFPDEPATNLKQFILSEKEYKELLDTLAKGLVLMLSAGKKATHGIDSAFIDISYNINGELKVLKDIELPHFYLKLYKYLFFEAFKNK